MVFPKLSSPFVDDQISMADTSLGSNLVNSKAFCGHVSSRGQDPCGDRPDTAARRLTWPLRRPPCPQSPHSSRILSAARPSGWFLWTVVGMGYSWWDLWERTRSCPSGTCGARQCCICSFLWIFTLFIRPPTWMRLTGKEVPHSSLFPRHSYRGNSLHPLTAVLPAKITSDSSDLNHPRWTLSSFVMTGVLLKQKPLYSGVSWTRCRGRHPNDSTCMDLHSQKMKKPCARLF